MSSTSSTESNSLGRRRRDGKQIEESQYSPSIGSRSESSLVVPVEGNRDPEDLSDTESLDGRRVRPKYSIAGGERRTTSWDTPGASSGGSRNLAWRNSTSVSQDAIETKGNSVGTGEGRAHLPQFLHRNMSEEAVRLRGYSEVIHANNANSEGAADSIQSSSRPLPPRKDSDLWDPPRSFQTTSARGIRPGDSSSQLARSTSVREHNRPSYQPVGMRDTSGQSPSLGRIRALSRPSNLHGDRPSRGEPPTSPYSRLSRSEIVLPRWQPDAEVTLCPICRTQFSKNL